MDPMVSARVPVELRDQVNEGLRTMGSSPTELINKAYEFFLETKTLPERHATKKAGRRTLNRKQRAELLRSIEATTCAVPESFFGGKSDEQILSERMRSAYEALA